MGGLFQWPIKFNSGWVVDSSRDNNYKYQQEYEKKFMDKIDETYNTRKSDFPINYEAILEIPFD